MKIGILSPPPIRFKEKDAYNAQYIGLGKELRDRGHQVVVYTAMYHDEIKQMESMGENMTVHYIPCIAAGKQSLFPVSVMDHTIDALFVFADNQYSVPRAYRWAKKRGIRFIPYIGVLKSNSDKRWHRIISNALLVRNVNIYRGALCLAKTKTAAEELESMGIKDYCIAPVGLDIETLKSDYKGIDRKQLRKKYGYTPEDQVILFVGRMHEEKRPVDMLRIFMEVNRKNRRTRLLMVGQGKLKQEVLRFIDRHSLYDRVNTINSINNKDIWELYLLADMFVNLNKHEIFGMAIMEAMYYGCRVIAYQAPGPNLLITDSVTGDIAANDKEIVMKILDFKDYSEASHAYAVDRFSWKQTAIVVEGLAF